MLAAFQLAKEGGARIILDCGGAEGRIDEELLSLVSILSPNETELARLTGSCLSQQSLGMLPTANACEHAGSCARTAWF